MASTLSVLKTPRWRQPKWFDKFVRSIEQTEPFNGYTTLRRAGVDHIRGYKNVAILQPYHAYGEDLLALLSACKEQGLKTFFSGMTNHYPGATFTIVIYRPDDEEQAMKFTHEAVRTNIEVPEGIPK